MYALTATARFPSCGGVQPFTIRTTREDSRGSKCNAGMARIQQDAQVGRLYSRNIQPPFDYAQEPSDPTPHTPKIVNKKLTTPFATHFDDFRPHFDYFRLFIVIYNLFNEHFTAINVKRVVKDH